MENSSAGCIPDNKVGCSPAKGQAFGGRDPLGVVERYSSGCDELYKAFAVAAHIALHFCQRWQFLAFGLADVFISRFAAEPLRARCNPRVVLLDGSQAKMTAMSIYRVLRKAERFGVSFRVCDSKGAGVGSCDQFLTGAELRAIVLSTHSALTLWASRISSVGCTPREAISNTSRVRSLTATSPSSREVQSKVLLARDQPRSRASPAQSTIGLVCSRPISSTAFAATPRTGEVCGKVVSTPPPGALSPKN